MKVALSCCGALGLSAALLPAAPLSEITAEIVPAKVRPGDLFELRVKLMSIDYAQFELQVPTHERLHRVAVEAVPVRFEDGRYHQSERWILQADSSGEILIDGATLLFEPGSGSAPFDLPTLRVDVMAYAEQDASAEPVGFPIASPEEANGPVSGWWWVVPCLLVLLASAWRMAKGRRAPATEDPGELVALETVLAELDTGELRSPALERMMLEQGGAWSGGLRKAVESALYAGRGQGQKLAAMLRKEVDR